MDILLEETVAGAFYYLYSSLPDVYNENNPYYGLSPGGMANGKNGSDYYGLVFWDMVLPRIIVYD